MMSASSSSPDLSRIQSRDLGAGAAGSKAWADMARNNSAHRSECWRNSGKTSTATTIFAGYCGGVLGYVATPEEYPHGGYEPAVAQRGYGHPAPFTPDVAGIIRDTSLELLAELFPDA